MVSSEFKFEKKRLTKRLTWNDARRPYIAILKDELK